MTFSKASSFNFLGKATTLFSVIIFPAVADSLFSNLAKVSLEFSSEVL